jgi:predicted anti-sigma-YlaC factor YlaD
VKHIATAVAAAWLLSLTACSTAASKVMASALSAGGPNSRAFSSDDDPELVKDAVPFGLKTMESVLEEQPRHVGLLTALTGGFTQYAYAFVQADADAAELEGKTAAARAGRDRARKLYLRARDYGLRGLDARHEGMAAKLRSMRDLPAALRDAELEDVPLLYWTAASWALAISNGKEQMDLVAELPAPEALAERALALDESWSQGALHEFFVSFDAARGAASGGGPKAARAHLDRAQALSHGKKLGGLVAYAEGVSVQAQDKREFEQLLKRVVDFEADDAPDFRLANLIAQKRAKLLLAHEDDLFP